MSDLMLDVDQAGEVKAAFRRGKWTNADIKRFCEGTVTTQVLPFVRGEVKQIPTTVHATNSKSRFGRVEVKHIIDLDAAPFVPDGWSYREKDQLPKRARGEFVWDAAKTRLHFSPNQQGGKVITGNELRKELKRGKHTVLGANVLDYLLEHPELIPDEWKGKAIFFWGTIYRNAGGSLVVRCLYWFDGRWISGDFYLGHDWLESDPALVRAS